MDHEYFIHRCLQLASLGRQKVGNGAMVGAVLVREGKVIIDGYHNEFGKSHAELYLLEKFEQEIYPNDVLYVNLEPCCHQGKTPPCTDIILERGIKNVIYGMQDPDPRVAGRGIALLRSRGVKVEGPVVRPLCERLNRGFISVRTRERPWIILKCAQTVDGSISNADGSPLKITSNEQNAWSHTYLRSQVDAILVGNGTIRRDDPSLTVRFVQKNSSIIGTITPDYQPWRIILDSDLRIPQNAKVVTDDHKLKTIIIHRKDLQEGMNSKMESIKLSGVKLVSVSSDHSGFLWEDLWKALATPEGDFQGITSILVEGGARTWKKFKKSGCVDEEVVLIGKGEK